MIAVANEPVTLGLLQREWNGEEEDEKTQQLRKIKQGLEILPTLPPDLQEQLQAMPPEAHAMLDNLPPKTATRLDPVPLLRYLTAVGLVTEQRDDPDDGNPTLFCHELVRERSRARMDAHPDECAGLTENSIRLAYAGRLAAAFEALQHRDMSAALEAGSRALVYCVQAGAYEQLGKFASDVVTSISDLRLLEALLPHLQAAAEAAPMGKLRWSCLCYLADALVEIRPDTSLPFYEQAAAQARNAAEVAATDSSDARLAWSDVGWITGNWSIALRGTGNLNAARRRLLESAEAQTNAGALAVTIMASELEALRIAIMQGQSAQALPQVEARLAQLEAWWRQHRCGEPIPDAPDPGFLARAYISALDIAKDAHFARKDWQAALPHIEASLEVKRSLKRPAEDIAIDRMNRANVLNQLARFGEAQAELEACLQVFEHNPASRGAVFSSLADLFYQQGDATQAIILERRSLALCETLPDPCNRAISHNNLANYLYRSGTPPDLAEAPSHRLAALVYRLVAGLGQHLQSSLYNYIIDFRRAHDAGTELSVPRVAELLADTAFNPLAAWLRGRQLDVEALQAEVDRFLATAQQAALEQAPAA